MPAMYDEIADWYPVLTPPEDYEDEAGWYLEHLRGGPGALRSLLELGCGAGHNAVHMKDGLEVVLTDLSPKMLAHSRALNPDCEHHLADMRTLRLGRTFDAVFAHDAIAYMRTREDLAAAVQTAAAHLRPGGVFLVAPDDVADTFEEEHEVHEGQQGDRAMRCLEWSWDPDPDDDTFVTEYVFTLRHGTDVRVVHDRHVQGLFPEAVWVETMQAAGFDVTRLTMLDDDWEYVRFLGVLRAGPVDYTTP